MTEQERRDAIRDQVAQSRLAQGLPRTVEDPVVLAQLAAILVEANEEKGT